MSARVDQGDGVFQPAEVAETVWVAGRARLTPGIQPRRVRLDGGFLPVTPLLTAQRWRIDTTLVSPQPTLGGLRGPSKLVATDITLDDLDGQVDRPAGPFLLALHTDTGSYHAVASAAIADRDVLRVTADPHSLRHVDGRARP